MAKIDQEYKKLVNTVLNKGVMYDDPNRKNVRRLEIPRYSFYHSFSDGFPAITTKKLAWKSIVGETLWILRGQTNIKPLVDNKIPIWNKDSYNHYCKECVLHNVEPTNIDKFIEGIKNSNCDKNHFIPSFTNYKLGDLGPVYGYQLRNFGGEFDQLKWLIDEMVNNPLSTKKDVTFINPNDRDKQALTPCHTGFSILMRKDLSGFDLEFKLSSWDLFHGAPFNIAGYALIAKILSKLTGLVALGIHCTGHNIHVYEPHLTAVHQQLLNNVDEHGNCELVFGGNFNNADNAYSWGDMSLDEFLNCLEIKDFKLDGYQSYPPIKAEMLAYDKDGI